MSNVDVEILTGTVGHLLRALKAQQQQIDSLTLAINSLRRTGEIDTEIFRVIYKRLGALEALQVDN